MDVNKVQKTDISEVALSVERLVNIENRLCGVEDTLGQLIANGQETKEEMKAKLSEIQLEIEKNTSQVKNMRRRLNSSQNNSKFLFVTIICVLILWTIFMNYFKVESL